MFLNGYIGIIYLDKAVISSSSSFLTVMRFQIALILSTMDRLNALHKCFIVNYKYLPNQ